MNTLISAKIESFYRWWVRPRQKTHNLVLIDPALEPSKQNMIKFTFYQHSQQLYDFLSKEVENLNFVQGVNFEFIDSSKNKGPRHLLIFENSVEKIRNSNKFVVIALAGSYRGLKTLYFKHKLFHWSKLCAIETQIRTSLLVSKRSTCSLRSFYDWFVATNRRFTTLLHNTGSSPSKFYIPDRLKHIKLLDEEHTTSLYSSSVLINFHICPNPFLQSWSKNFIRFLCQCILNFFKRNLQSIKTHHVTKSKKKFDCLL